jgi:hypothetical protein
MSSAVEPVRAILAPTNPVGHPEAPHFLQRGEGSRAECFEASQLQSERPRGCNSNVSKILPVTTLRTIDLGGKKNSGPLFSGFCAKTRVFFEVNYAPKYVQDVAVDVWPDTDKSSNFDVIDLSREILTSQETGIK